MWLSFQCHISLGGTHQLLAWFNLLSSGDMLSVNYQAVGLQNFSVEGLFLPLGTYLISLLSPYWLSHFSFSLQVMGS